MQKRTQSHARLSVVSRGSAAIFRDTHSERDTAMPHDKLVQSIIDIVTASDGKLLERSTHIASYAMSHSLLIFDCTTEHWEDWAAEIAQELDLQYDDKAYRDNETCQIFYAVGVRVTFDNDDSAADRYDCAACKVNVTSR
jgi:hypothetical protein